MICEHCYHDDHSGEVKGLNRYGRSDHFFYDRKFFTRLCYDGHPSYWFELIGDAPVYGRSLVYIPIERGSDMWIELERAYSVWQTHHLQV
jgi:hypothetical protein